VNCHQISVLLDLHQMAIEVFHPAPANYNTNEVAIDIIITHWVLAGLYRTQIASD
jgi:hypothetical protein